MNTQLPAEAKEHNSRIAHLGDIDHYWRFEGPTGDSTWNAPSMDDALKARFEVSFTNLSDLVGEKLEGLTVQEIKTSKDGDMPGQNPETSVVEIYFERQANPLTVRHWPVSYVLVSEADSIVAQWDNISEATWEAIAGVLSVGGHAEGHYGLVVTDDVWGAKRPEERLCVTGYDDTTDSLFRWDQRTKKLSYGD